MPQSLAEAIVKGAARERELDNKHVREIMEVTPKTSVEDKYADADPEPWMSAWDDTTGEALDPKEVQKARAKEMGNVHEKGVWKTVPRADAVRNGWKLYPPDGST